MAEARVGPMPKPIRYCEWQRCNRALPHTLRADARFCCPAHRNARHRYVTVGRLRWIVVGGEDRHCAHCGGLLVPLGLDQRRSDAKFCSTRCRVAAHRATRRGREEPSAMRQGNPPMPPAPRPVPGSD
jgi:hypothetical protein